MSDTLIPWHASLDQTQRLRQIAYFSRKTKLSLNQDVLCPELWLRWVFFQYSDILIFLFSSWRSASLVSYKPGHEYSNYCIVKTISLKKSYFFNQKQRYFLKTVKRIAHLMTTKLLLKLFFCRLIPTYILISHFAFYCRIFQNLLLSSGCHSCFCITS